MPQTLVISTPEAVSTTSRTFPKQGVFNLKITKNDKFDTVEIWVRSTASNITLELAGASFQATAQVTAPRIIPPTPTVISGSTLALTLGVTQYMKIKLNNGISVAHLRCSYDARTPNAIVAGGNVKGQAFVDYAKKPYITTSLERMFVDDSVKNDLTKWDVSSVTSLTSTFSGNETFNQPIGNWDVSSAISMNRTFFGATSFNQPIGNWNVGSVTTMQQMFIRASSFNQPIGNWNVGSVTIMSGLFDNASSFNQPIGNWNVSNVVSLIGIFHGATLFNQDLSSWDVSKVASMYHTFRLASSFNKPIGNWDVSNVTTMHQMFDGATSFNQDLSSWAAKFNVDVILTGFFSNTAWGTTHYDKFLNALRVDINTTRPQSWSSRTAAKILDMGTSKYSAASATARAFLVSNGWTITDGGLAA